MNRCSIAVSAFILFAAAAQAAVPSPFSPSGLLATSTPSFRWSSTGAARYTIEITRDGSDRQTVSTTVNSYEPANPLAVGAYSWRVREGRLNQDFPWSAPLKFVRPPQVPTLVLPGYRAQGITSPTTLVFTWNSADPVVNRFDLKIYKDGALLESYVTNVTGPGPFTAVRSLTTGSYSWQVRAWRAHANAAFSVKSDWTNRPNFSIIVPPVPVITRPAADGTMALGSYDLTIQTLGCVSATHYKYGVLLNNKKFAEITSASTNVSLFNTYGPGYYTLYVVASNNSGYGAVSSLRTLRVERIMTPGNRSTFTSPPAKLEWSRSLQATRYFVRLFRYNNQSGVFDLIKESWVKQPIGQPAWKPGAEHLVTGAYRWHVTDYRDDAPLMSSTSDFRIGVPYSPYPGSPVNDGAGLRGVFFSWKAANAGATHYQFQVWKGGTLVYDSGWGPKTDYPYKSSYGRTLNLTDAGPGTYIWRVRARNAAGAGPWSRTKVKLKELVAPGIIAPANNSYLSIGQPADLVWNSVPNARVYRIEMWDKYGELDGPNYQPAQPGATQTYTWMVGLGPRNVRVRAETQAGYGPWSKIYFTADE
jgi:hypothetical protein